MRLSSFDHIQGARFIKSNLIVRFSIKIMLALINKVAWGPKGCRLPSVWYCEVNTAIFPVEGIVVVVGTSWVPRSAFCTLRQDPQEAVPQVPNAVRQVQPILMLRYQGTPGFVLSRIYDGLLLMPQRPSGRRHMNRVISLALALPVGQLQPRGAVLLTISIWYWLSVLSWWFHLITPLRMWG